MNASELKKGEMAVISNVSDGPLRLKLTEMGCVPGQTIEKLHIAALGDPSAFRINGYLLGLRQTESEAIVVEKF